MLLLKKLKQEGFCFTKLPDDLQQAADIVLTAADELQKIQMLDLVTYKTVRKLYKKEVENTITDIAFNNMPGNDGFNTSITDNPIFAAGGIIETPQQLGSALKNYFKAKHNITILTRYIKTVRGLDGSWYKVSSFRSGQTIPNEVRQEIIKRFSPEAQIRDWNDIHYGNIRSQNISLYGKEWKEFLQAQEGKMAKGGPTMGEIIKAKPATNSQQPKWLFNVGYVNASVYCDTRKQSGGDYKEICRVIYKPLELSISYKNKNEEYEPIVEMAKQEYRNLFNKNPAQLPNGTASYSKVQLSHEEIMNGEKFGTFAGQVSQESMKKAWKENTPISEQFAKTGKPYPPFTAQHYANAFELNKAIEKLLDSKPIAADFIADEKAFLKYYSGYGGMEKHGATGKGLLYEYYTPSLIAEKMWGLAYKYGFNGGAVLEPSAGIGEFIKYAPEQHLIVSHEINKYSARICKILYPLITISTQYFEEIFIKNNDSIRGKTNLLKKYKLVIGNPPYGEFGGKWAGMGEKSYTRAGNYIDYFIFRGLDLLDTGGLLVFIVGAEVASGGKCFLSQQMNKCKDEIMEKADLLDAYRLPNGVFERTDVLSDIIVLQKK